MDVRHPQNRVTGIAGILLDGFVHRTLAAIREQCPSANFLEIGCGDQRYRQYLDEGNWRCIFTDVEARCESGTMVLTSAESLPFSDSTFDIVMMIEVLEHIPDIRAALSEIGRVLRPGGWFVVTFPFNYSLHELPADYRRWTEFNAVREFEAAGIGVEAFERRGDAIAVLLTIADHLMTGALAALKRKRWLIPLYWVLGVLWSMSRFAAVKSYTVYHRTVLKARVLKDAGEGLEGVRGRLQLWHLGYQFVCRKNPRH